jgi:hypothetical protein
VLLPVPVASFSVGVPSFSVRAAQAAISSALAPRPVLQAFRRVAGPCIPHVPRRAARRAAVLASASVRVARAVDLALASVRVGRGAPQVAWCRLRVKHHVRSVRVVHHAAVDASSTRRPRKAR